ncbi:FAD-binding domain-containing protein [Gymnopus androsaceus JB14]|uniref:FAD-binding domain-containing protein n=1 Tax=Gymnopus androsaceus JB14 TaxID=1447944 RepID=A0A6A4HGX4_9AGAR|nr:FAD-binding domain-containing protein [Gymnopus androsaceus JB14]
MAASIVQSASNIKSEGAYPSSEAWVALNTSVDGRLQPGIPFARPCFPLASNETKGHFSPSDCNIVEADYLNHLSISNTVGGYINTQWETCQRTGQECLLDWTLPSNAAATMPPRICSQGSVPTFAIDVRNATDVLRGLEFSKEYNISLAIKNTGHDYKGRSGGPGALALWLHNLKSIEFAPNFIPQNCPSAMRTEYAVTVGAGVQFSDLIPFATEHNITIPSGGDLSVGAAGGYPQGGGHGILSNVYGLAADRVLEYEVITPRGEHIIANDCQYSDLFYALRGGGGGTFGVVLKMTTKALPGMPVNAVFSTFNSTVPGNRLEFIRFMVENSLTWAQQGWGTYIIPSEGILLANTVLQPAAANESMKELREFMTGNLTGTFLMTVEPNYETFFNNYIGALIHVPVGVPLTPASRLIPVQSFSENREQLISTLNDIQNVDILIAFGTTPFLFGSNNRTSVTPAWRDSLWHVVFGDIWNYDTSTTDISQKYSNLSAVANGLRDFTPDSGAYQNEADVYEPNHEESFWGNNYPLLLSIKQKYDPDHILDCWQCVGWRGPSSPQYSCYIEGF